MLLRFSESLNEQSIAILMKHGLKKRYSHPVEVWKGQIDGFVRRSKEEMAVTRGEFETRVRDDSAKLLAALESMIVENILSLFP